MKKAFTMIELIFVIVIIGILASIAIPKLAATRDDAINASIAKEIALASSEISSYSVAVGALDNNFSSMSAAVKSMVDKGIAFQSGTTLNIKSGNISDCIKIIIPVGLRDVNITLERGNAGNDISCQGLQDIIDIVHYSTPLKGSRIK